MLSVKMQKYFFIVPCEISLKLLKILMCFYLQLSLLHFTFVMHSPTLSLVILAGCSDRARDNVCSVDK